MFAPVCGDKATGDSEHARALHVRNFPSEFSASDVGDLLRYFGACSVSTREFRGRLEATAEFRNEAEALVTLLRLHQQKLGTKRLRAVFASPGDPCHHPVEEKPAEVVEEPSVVVDEVKQIAEEQQASVGSHPPPCRETLLKIANAMGNRPEFYLKVLRLMKVLELPSLLEVGHDVFEKGIFSPSEREAVDDRQLEDMQVSSGGEESELEEEPGSAYDAGILPQHLLPHRRPSAVEADSAVDKAKRVLRAAVTSRKTDHGKRKSQGSTPAVGVETCFDSVKKVKKELVVPTSLDLPVPRTVVPDQGASIRVIRNVGEPAGFGVFGSASSTSNADQLARGDSSLDGEFYSRKFIAQNRVSEKDFEVLPPFKNYAPGDPTARLYIKNLAKSTDVEDLRKVFGGYVDWVDPKHVAEFDIKVLKEGRMKGQAFVSLPNVEAAQLARKDTNGFLLHGKPMVVSFARSASAK